MSTENRNPKSFGLDKMSAQEIVHLMNEEERVVLRAVQAAEDKVATVIDRVAKVFKRGGRIVYVGAGTSGRIAALDAAEMIPTFGVEEGRFIALQAGGAAALSKAIEDAEDNEYLAIRDISELEVSRKDIMIGISASGRTPYVLAAIRYAQRKGVWTCGIANINHSPLLEESSLGIFLDTGPEVLTGSTRLKAGTSQKLVLNAISTGAMVLAGKVVENLMVDVTPKNSKLKARCVRIVRELTTLTEQEAIDCLEEHHYNIRLVLEKIGRGAGSFSGNPRMQPIT